MADTPAEGENNFLPPSRSLVLAVQSPPDHDSAAKSKGTTENWHVLHTENTAIHDFRTQIAAR